MEITNIDPRGIKSNRLFVYTDSLEESSEQAYRLVEEGE